MSERWSENPDERRAGILLHPTSLPSPYGIGELGREAFEFVEFLQNAGQRLWQVLPLNPADTGGSPYSSSSAFAGNPLLISTERLVSGGLLPAVEKEPVGPVDYLTVNSRKPALLQRAYENAKLGRSFERFREENRGWLGDYALYLALKKHFGGRPWHKWDEELSSRKPEALEKARKSYADEVRFHEYVQYLFFEHWQDVKTAANEAGIEMIGDLPIFVAHDSADVWTDQELFHLDASGSPTVVAGVPPDYFSETGQLWGNPLYDWDALSASGYDWWVRRLRAALTLYDSVRIDHFRGFESYWEIPAGAPTAIDGRWVQGPGRDFFRAIEAAIENPSFIAEDLGDVGPEVEDLRRASGLPGMKVLQFAFSGPENGFLPHNYPDENWVVYTGTHDNDTTAGWWASATTSERTFARRYLGREYASVEDFVRAAYASVARRAVVPMQDHLSLGSEARMNTPGTPSGNWRWRLHPSELGFGLAERLHGLARLYGR